MAKLSTKVWLDRAVEKLGSVTAVAEKLGRSRSTINAIRAGKRPGEKLFESARDIAKGKRAPVAPPPVRAAKPIARPVPPPVLTSLQRAERAAALALDKLDPGTRVVISVTTKDGRGVVLGRHGGINVDVIPSNNIGGFTAGQASDQSYDLDDDDIVDISIEDYEDFV